jgi:hypothetical protein
MCTASVSSLAAGLSKVDHRRIHLKKKAHHMTADEKHRLNSLVSETRGCRECNDVSSRDIVISCFVMSRVDCQHILSLL